MERFNLNKTLIIVVLCLSLVSLTACSDTNKKSSVEPKKDEIIIDIPKEKSRNLERFETFSQNVKNKKNDEIQIINYLYDYEVKVPALNTVTYKDEKFTFTSKYNSNYSKDVCNKLVTPQETHDQAYMLRDCSQSEDGIILHHTARDDEGSYFIKDKRVEFIEVEGDKTYIFVKDLEVEAFVNAVSTIENTNFDFPSNTSNTQKSNYKINIHFLSGKTQTYYLWIDKEKAQGIIMDSEQTNHGHELHKIDVEKIIKVLNKTKS